jgi:autotransporter-associated beta strand protein/T5SS/PEP-CTERM-associated repeat protein
VSNGGTFSSASLRAGNGSNSINNTITISGAGSQWKGTSDNFLGYGGGGNSLNIVEGGTYNAGWLVAGNEASSSSNSITVSGVGSLLTNGSGVIVGLYASGNTMTVSNGAIVNIGSGLSIGRYAGSSNNSVVITGQQTVFTNNGGNGSSDFYIGNTGSKNSLVISDGATVSGGNGYISYNNTSSNNSVVVTGSNSSWNLKYQLRVGYGSTNNSLSILNGATVKAAMGTFITSDSTVVISGSGSSLTSQFVNGGGGTLTIANGAKVTTEQGFQFNSGIGIINIGRFGGNDTAGSIITTGNTYELQGTGIINFNQSDSIDFTNLIGTKMTINQYGSGTTVLSGNNINTNITTVTGGTLRLGTATSVGDGSVNVRGGTFDLNNIILTNGITLSGGTLTNGTVMTSQLNGQSGTLAASLAGGGGFIKSGAGTLILVSSNSYTGTTTISAGALQIGNGGTSGTISTNNIVNNGSLIFNRSDSIRVINPISGTGSFTMFGTGTTTLTASNSFQGPTYVSAGTLLINGTNMDSAISVSSGATLGGTGSLGAVTIQDGGTLSTTNSFGQMHVASLSLASNSIIKLAVAGTNSTQFDSIYAAGSIAFGGSLNINMSGVYDSINNIGLFQLFSNGSGSLGSSSNNFTQVNITGSYNGSLAYFSANNLWQLWNSTNSYIGLNMTTGQLTVIPEPSTYALFGLGAIGLLMVSRRKKA